MKEKQKPQQQDNKQDQKGGAFGSGPFDNVTNSKQITIESGQYMDKVQGAGMTVKQIRKEFAAQFNIAAGAVSIINKKEVGDDTVLQEGQVLKFLHKSGEKGC